jgi:hypothetical protein
MRLHPFVFASLVLMFAARAQGAEPIQLQKAETTIDDRGCVHFGATARIDVQIDDLFEALSRPERLLAHGCCAYPHLIFLPSSVTGESMSENKWTIGWPFKKILEFEGDGDGVTKDTKFQKTWVEYDFDRLQHTVHQYDIGSTYPWGLSNPHSDSTYVLSPLDNGSATAVRYTNVKCYPRETWNKLAPDKEMSWRFSSDLDVAQAEAELMAEKRLKAPSPSATPTCVSPPQTIPTATVTPLTGSFGATR